MGNNKELGLEGEQLASDYLTAKGYIIRHKNYRYKRAEIDIIAECNQTLVFVEVKYRKNNSFGYPEDFVDERKQELIQSAAENYVLASNWMGNIRFDIVSITRSIVPDMEHIEDAF